MDEAENEGQRDIEIDAWCDCMLARRSRASHPFRKDDKCS